MKRTALQRLRRRLLALWGFFSKHTRLVDAQNMWRGNQAGFREEVKRRERRLDRPFQPLPAEPTRIELGNLLAELEAVDQAAWNAAGGPQAPFQRFRNQRTGETCWLVPLACKRVSADSHQGGRIYAHICHHVIVKAQVDLGGTAISIDVRQTHGLWLKQALRGPSKVRVETMSFADGAHLTPRPPEWRGIAHGISKKRRRAIRKAIRSAAKRGVQVLVFPELTILPRHRRAAIELLQDRLTRAKPNPWITVLGSFHQRIGEHTFNTSLMVNHHGAVLGFERDKRPPWELISHRKISAMGKWEVFKDGESISVHDELRLYVTPFGLTALAICKDYLDAFYARLWQDVAPDLVLVPAYGPGMRRHRDQAKELHRQFGTVSVVAHECSYSCVPDPVRPGRRRDRTEPELPAGPSEAELMNAARPAGAAAPKAPPRRDRKPEPGGSLVVGSRRDGTPSVKWRFKRPDDRDLGTDARFPPDHITYRKNLRN